MHPHPTSTLLLPSLFLGGGGGGYTGVTCLLLKVSKHPGESLFTPLKKVGIPISRRPSSPSATRVSRRRKEKSRSCDGDKSELFFFLACPAAGASVFSILLRSYLSLIFASPSASFLLFSLTPALPPRQTSTLWYPSFSVSAAMTHVPIHPPRPTLLVYSKSSSNRHGLLPFIEHFLLNKPSRHSTGWIFGLFKRIPSWRSPMQSRRRV